jgi:hypothetical protein
MSDVVEDLINDHEFIVALARFADGLTTQAAIKKRYNFTDDVWEQLGNNDALVEKIEAEKTRRIRRGDTARERAQTHFAAAPDVLNSIMNDSSASARNRIESAKELRVCADHKLEIAPAAAADRFVISINLGGGEILTFDKSITPQPHDDINNAPQELVLAKKREDDINSTGHNTAEGVVDDAEDDQLARKQTEGGGGQPL